MSQFNGLGQRVREGRESLGLSREQFADRVQCQVPMLERLEDGRPLSEPQGLLPVLERIARLIGTPIDVLLLSDTNLFSVRTNEMKLKAFQIIKQHGWTASLDVIAEVFAQIDADYEKALAERQHGALVFRKAEAALQIDEERVHDMVITARRHFN